MQTTDTVYSKLINPDDMYYWLLRHHNAENLGRASDPCDNPAAHWLRDNGIPSAHVGFTRISWTTDIGERREMISPLWLSSYMLHLTFGEIAQPINGTRALFTLIHLVVNPSHQNLWTRGTTGTEVTDGSPFGE